jgi:pimeloyl-ACP methyl ester carboxylesterase
MSLLLEYSVGLYAAGESQYLLRDRSTPINNTRRGVICLHGHGADSTVFMPGAPGASSIPGNHARALAEAGFIVMSIDAGGKYTWASDACMSSMTSAYNWLTTTGGAKPDKVGLIGWSMGGLSALNWMKRNSSLVSGVELFAPATELDYFYNGSYRDEVDFAYSAVVTNPSGSGTVNSSASTINVTSTTGFPSSGTLYLGSANGLTTVAFTGKTASSFTGCTTSPSFAYSSLMSVGRSGDFATNSSGHDPQDDASTYAGLTNKVRIYQGSADGTVPPARTQNFITLCNNSNFELISLSGFGHVDLFGAVSVTDTQRYFVANLGLT